MPKPHPYTAGQMQTGGNQNQARYNEEETRAMMDAYSMTRAKLPAQSANDPIKILMDELATKTGAIKLGTDESPRYLPTMAATAVSLSFNDTVPSPVVSNNILANLYFENDALRATIYKNSAYLKAGVPLAIIPDPNEYTTHAITHAQSTYFTVDPLNFEFVDDSTELQDQQSPVVSQGFKVGDDASIGATFTLSRRVLKDTPDYALRGLLYDAIAGGLGKAVDKAMAAYLGGLTLAPFSLALAGARGLGINELAGVTSGSSTDAALVEGNLYLKGIPAELCAAVGNYIFAPSRFAVAFPQTFRITAKRLTNGAVEITTWANAEILATSQSNTAAWSA